MEGWNKEVPAPLLRRRFSVAAPVRSAWLHVCGLGYGVYWINGAKATEDVLITPYTKYDATVLYSSFDVTSLIRQGDNVFAAMLGNGFYNDITPTWNSASSTWRHHPKLIMQLSLLFADGREETILSDSSFVTAEGPVLFNHARCGEIYDARLEREGWTTAAYDDSGWERARICRGPGGILKPALHPPIRVTGTLTARKISGSLYDLGQNISGWARIRVKGEAGREISLTYGELLHPDGTLDNEHINKFNPGPVKHRDLYICKGGEQDEEYEPAFVYHGFRYVEVGNAPEEFQLEGRVVHTDLQLIGDFQCSDELLNKIHQATRWSTLTNYHGLPTDCPHREQNGWTGDALLSAEQSLMNYEMEEAYLKWLLDIRDAQRPNGQIPGIVPASSWGYNWGSGPAWDAALIHLPYYLYTMTGSGRAIYLLWESMEKYMAFMDSMAEDYIVDFGLGDWCAPPGAQKCSSAVTDTSFYYANARIMARCARVIGQDPARYEELAAHIREAFRCRFLRDGIVEGGGQTALACGIYQGLYEAAEILLAAERLARLVEEKGNHIDCGILGTKFIFSALSDNGYAETAYRMVTNPTMPSYAYWINSGMTTLCEDWSMTASYDGKTTSLNHHMFSEVDMWFYKHLAGIRLTEEGLVIKPCFVDEIAWVKARHRELEVDWDQEGIRIMTPREAILQLEGKRIILAPGEHRLSRRGQQ
jgi:alpha-L-rhamnosidase